MVTLDDAIDAILSAVFTIITLIVYALSVLIINYLIYGTITIAGIQVSHINGLIDYSIWEFIFLSIFILLAVIALYIAMYKCYLNIKLESDYFSRFIKPFSFFIAMDVIGIIIVFGTLLLFEATTNIPLIGTNYNNILLDPKNLIPITERLVAWGIGIVLFISYIILVFKGYYELVLKWIPKKTSDQEEVTDKPINQTPQNPNPGIHHVGDTSTSTNISENIPDNYYQNEYNHEETRVNVTVLVIGIILTVVGILLTYYGYSQMQYYQSIPGQLEMQLSRYAVQNSQNSNYMIFGGIASFVLGLLTILFSSSKTR